MRNRIRRTATKVRDGRTQRKNCWTQTPDNFDGIGVAIERKRPGTGFRHVLSQNDVFEFLRVIPSWDRHSIGLNRIVLDQGSEFRFGWYHRGVIGLNAMESNLAVGLSKEAFYRDINFFDQVGVDYELRPQEEERDDGTRPRERTVGHDWPDEVFAVCHFTREQARCFHLVRTVLHELGHHIDRTTNPKQWCSRGEEFAETLGRQMERKLWKSYCKRFGNPAKC